MAERYQYFRELYCLLLQGERENKEANNFADMAKGGPEVGAMNKPV
jgi:hypothetical protein